MGKRTKGRDKEQLRLDEARLWNAAALRWAKKHDGPISALAILYMDIRCIEVVSRVVRDLDDDGRLLVISGAKTIAGDRVLEIPDVLRPFFARLAKGKAPNAYLFGDGTAPRTRGYPLKWTYRICALAGVPRVSAHAMRRLHATLAITHGATSQQVAAAMGHGKVSVTRDSYIKRGTIEETQRTGMLDLLHGERRGPDRVEADPPILHVVKPPTIK